MKSPNVLSLIAVAISAGAVITVLCVRCNSDTDWDFDFYGTLIGVLSLLVTLLVGWQIFQTITMKDEVKKIIFTVKSTLEDNIKAEIDKAKKYAYASGKDSFAISMFESKLFGLSITSFFEAIIVWAEIQDDENLRKSVSHLDSAIDALKKAKEELSIDEELRTNLLSGIVKLSDKELRLKYTKYITGLKSTNDSSQ